MIEAVIKAFIHKELPCAMSEDLSIQDFSLPIVSEFYSPKIKFYQRFDRILRVNTLYFYEPRARVIEIYGFDKFKEKLNEIMQSHFFDAVPQDTQLN